MNAARKLKQAVADYIAYRNGILTDNNNFNLTTCLSAIELADAVMYAIQDIEKTAALNASLSSVMQAVIEQPRQFAPGDVLTVGASNSPAYPLPTNAKAWTCPVCREILWAYEEVPPSQCPSCDTALGIPMAMQPAASLGCDFCRNMEKAVGHHCPYCGRSL